MRHHEEWKRLFDSSAPQNEDLPDPYQNTLNKFQKIIVLKAIRSDKVIPCIQDFVAKTMG